MREFDERAFGLTEYLQFNAGKEPVEDSRKSGYISCVRDLLSVELKDVTKETS